MWESKLIQYFLFFPNVQNGRSIQLYQYMGATSMPPRKLSMFPQKELPFVRSQLADRPTTKMEFHRIPQPTCLQDFPQEQQQFQVYKKSEKKIEEVRVRWRNFIKMKQIDFQEEYEVRKQIGRGGFGCVYKVIGKYNGTVRAAKKIKKSDLDAKQHQRLFNQVSILQSLDHPNIVKLFEVYDMADQYVLIMELCEGGELFKQIAKKRITLRVMPKIMRQLLEVLTYIHSKGVVHRDIKPENILINKSTSDIKIIDFGIATVKQTPQTILTARIGTIYYISPEVICKEYNQKCDVWAAGVVFYTMLFSQPPFRGTSQTEIICSILNDSVTYHGRIWTQLPKEAKNLLANMLKKRPNCRLTALQALGNEWLMTEELNDEKTLNNTRKNMTYFGFKNRLEAVVFTYCISQLLTNEEKHGLEEIFKHIDTNSDGTISYEELRQVLKGKVKDQLRLESIMRVIDLDGSGSIEYTQFLISALNPRSYLKAKHYEKAFDYFDIDHSGDISYEEIAKFLEGQESQEAIKEIFEEIDSDGNGNISREQFVNLFMKYAQNSMKTINSNKQIQEAKRKLTLETSAQELAV